jgi:hypothetical protein
MSHISMLEADEVVRSRKSGSGSGSEENINK